MCQSVRRPQSHKANPYKEGKEREKSKTKNETATRANREAFTMLLKPPSGYQKDRFVCQKDHNNTKAYKIKIIP